MIMDFLEKLRQTPVLVGCTVFSCLCLALYYTSNTVLIALTFLLLVGIIFGIVLKVNRYGAFKRSGNGLILICISSLLACTNIFCFWNIKIKNIYGYTAEPVKFAAEICGISYTSTDESLYTVKVRAVNGNKVSFGASLNVAGEYRGNVNDIIIVSGSFSLIPEEDDGFALRKYSFSKGIYLNAEATSDSVSTVGQSKSIFAKTRTLSELISARLSFLLGNESGELASAMLLGRRSELTGSLRRDFGYLGISHILAVSGLHLSVICGTFVKLLRLAKVRHTVIFFITTALIIAYILLTGMPLSVIRSGVMLFFYFFTVECRARNDRFVTLSIAAAGILLFSPSSAADIGFLLSVTATLGIITVGSKFLSVIGKYRQKKPRHIQKLCKIYSALSVTLSAFIFTLPVVWIYFGEISLLSFAANLIYIPLSTAFLILSVLALLIPSGVYFAPTASSLGHIITDSADLFARISPEPISLRYSFVPIVFASALLCCLLILPAKRKSIFCIFLPIAVFFSSFSFCYGIYRFDARSTTLVSCISHGESDIMTLLDGGRSLLCDLSNGRTTALDQGISQISDEFFDTSPDVWLITRPRSTHILSFRKITESNVIRKVILPLPQNEDEELIYLRIVDLAKQAHVELLSYDTSTYNTIRFCDTRIEISPYVYLKRSTQPMYYITVTRGDDSLTYFSASVFESSLGGEALSAADNSDNVWLGAHGPNIKAPLPESLSSHISLIVSAPANKYYLTSHPLLTDRKTYKLS